MLHEEALALNCGRGALEYLCKSKKSRNYIFHIFFVLLYQIYVKRLVFHIVVIILIKISNQFSNKILVIMNGFIL